MKLDQITETALALVPTGKSIVWLVGVAGSMFLAGVGFTVSTSEYAELPVRVDHLADSIIPAMRAQLTQQRSELVAFRAELNTARTDREKILCLVELAAAGEQLSPLEVNRRCP